MIAAGLALGACSGGRVDGDVATVATSAYPLTYVVERVAERHIPVHTLAPAGVEPHDLELTSAGVRTLSEADLVLYLGGGFQPALEKVARDLETDVDVLAELPGTDPEDPHVWLDPVHMTALTKVVADRLAEIDPGGTDAHATNAAALRKELRALHRAYERRLTDCRTRAFVTSHAAFGYLARRYDLEQIGIAGIDPEAEPTPQSVLDAARFAQSHGVTTIFYETLVSPKLAEVVAAEADVATDVLNPIETEPETGDYADAMRANLSSLVKALGCR